MRVLFIDPGANPGFCLDQGGSDIGLWGYIEPTPEWVAPLDELVIEDQHPATHIYRNGRKVRVSRKSQQTLSFTAGRLYERYRAERKYRILANDWRAVLWPGARRLPKKVVLARLEAMLPPALKTYLDTLPKKNQPDVLEAWGMSQAWARLSQKQKEAYRHG